MRPCSSSLVSEHTAAPSRREEKPIPFVDALRGSHIRKQKRPTWGYGRQFYHIRVRPNFPNICDSSLPGQKIPLLQNILNI